MQTRTQKQLARAFTEWRRRVEQSPDQFLSAEEARALLQTNPQAYGESSAKYLNKVMEEIGE